MVKKYIELVFFAASLVGFYIFFSYVHPLIPYDFDDWRYLSYFRQAWPIWGSWNPTRILPETIMPLCGYLAAYVFRPLLGDYITSITVCSALIISAMIVVYLYSFYQLINKKFKMPFVGNLLITLIFLLVHFLIFASNVYNNTHLFFANDLTCYYFYVLPWLINAVLVLYLLKFDNFLVEVDIKKNGVLLLAFYLAIFSNIFHSVILIALIFVQLIIYYLKESNGNFCIYESTKSFVLKYLSWFVVILIWLISLFFEANGGRSNHIGYSLFALPIKDTLFYLGKLLKQSSRIFSVMLFVVFCSSGAIYWKNKVKCVTEDIFRDIVIKCFNCFLLVLLYVILISAKVGGTYIGSTKIAVSFLFYMLLLLLFSVAYIFHKYPRMISLLPSVCFILTVSTLSSNTHFRESYYGSIAPYKCILIDKDLINQIVEADKRGKTKMVLVVPKGDNKRANWPHPLYMGKEISKTLYAHGIISQNIEIAIKPDVNMNLKYRLGY